MMQTMLIVLQNSKEMKLLVGLGQTDNIIEEHKIYLNLSVLINLLKNVVVCILFIISFKTTLFSDIYIIYQKMRLFVSFI